MKRIGCYPGTDRENNVVSFVERHAAADPGRAIFRHVPRETLASWDGEQSLVHEDTTFGDFAAAVRHLAAGLARHGLSRGDRVLLFLPMSVAMYAAMTALQRLGVIPVFLDSWARRGQLGAAARVTQPRAIISFDQAFAALAGEPDLETVPLRIAAGPTSQECTAQLEELLVTEDEAEITPVAAGHTALITFTTGSSGEPKGADRTHGFLAAQHYALDACLPYGDEDVDLPAFPIFSLNNVAAGVTTVIPALDVGAPAERDAAVLLAQMRTCSVTCITVSPSLFNGLSSHCQRHSQELSGLRRVVTGGAPVSRDDLGRFAAVAPGASILVLYGSTEVEPIAHIEGREILDSPAPDAGDPELVEAGVDVGTIHPALRHRFIRISREPVTIASASDWAALEVPPGEPGELIVAGEHVCGGYFNNPQAGVRAKIRDPDGTLYHRTGDLGYLDERGHLWIVGRVHNAICRDGRWLFPVRAEIALRKLPFARAAAYLGLPDTALGERCVCAVQVGDGEADEPPPVWRSEVERILARNGLPADEIHFRADLPMDPRHHSKVEYDVLRRQILDEAGS